MVVGIAPPRPSPVRKRSQVNDCRPPLSADARLAPPNSTIEAISIVLRPWRSASGTDGERAEHQAEEAGGEQRAELSDVEPPLRPNRRRDEADDRRVEAVDGDDEEAEQQAAAAARPTAAARR